MKKPITINLLGDIAAGKGTQAEILIKKYNLKLVSTGEFTRKYWTGTSKISKRLEKTKLGKLTPTDIIKSYLRKVIGDLSDDEDILIDGVKMPGEARLLYGLLKKKKRRPLVIYLNIPQKEVFRRLTYRFYDKKTGEPLTIDPKMVKRGLYRGREVIKRADDRPEAVKNRIDYYRKVYSKTAEFWKEKGILKKINGNKSVSEVTKSIVGEIEKYYGP